MYTHLRRSALRDIIRKASKIGTHMTDIQQRNASLNAGAYGCRKGQDMSRPERNREKPAASGTVPRKSFIRRMRMPLPELEEYYRARRAAVFAEHGAVVTHLHLRSVIHHPLVSIIKLQRLGNGQKLVVLHDRRRRTDRPVIFCPTHIGGSDVEMAFESIRTSCWMMLGDPREIY